MPFFSRISPWLQSLLLCCGVSVLAPVWASAEPASPPAPAASAPAAPVTDDLVSGDPLPTQVKPDPAIDYGAPGAPELPRMPGARVINPAEVYVAPAGTPEEDAVDVVMPATPESPFANATLPQGNATLVQDNATLVPMNGTLPQVNATVPQVNATLPQVNATLPQVNATLPQVNATLPRTNATLPQVNATLPQTSVVVTQTNATAPAKVLTMADFLVKTPEKPLAEPPRKETPPKEAQKPEPARKPDPKPEPPQKPEPPKPPKAPEKKPEPPKPAAEKPRSGQELRIPPEALKNRDVSFLEGCWKGTRPEYNSKRIINERFCFDASGVGKRTIADPEYAGMCYGPTRAVINKDGVLKMVSGEAACTSGELWGAAEMICRGEGEQTPCYWQFPGVGKNASQSYKIRFVRE